MIRPPLAVACWLAWGVALAAPAAHAPAGSPLAAAGAALYNRGVLHDGTPLVGERDNAIPLSGAEAGCSNCHRRSALGTTEGRTVIPPIAGPYLFEAQAQRGAGQPPPYVAGIRSLRTPYTRDTLARALRDGVDPDGRALSYLMPRYALGEHDLDALIAHLKSIEPRRSPGVSTTELHFATILTPDTDPARRAAVLDVIRHFFTDRNAAPRGLDRQLLAPSGKELAAKSMFKVNRTWVLHVWEPSGPPQTWNAQLARLYAAEPVFAVISGYWGDHPEPVRDFCEQQRVPCLFPNVDRPPETGDADFYTLYFSRGVALEADLIAAGLVKEVATAGSGLTVRQIYRKGGAGEEAARALATR